MVTGQSGEVLKSTSRGWYWEVMPVAHSLALAPLASSDVDMVVEHTLSHAAQSKGFRSCQFNALWNRWRGFVGFRYLLAVCGGVPGVLELVLKCAGDSIGRLHACMSLHPVFMYPSFAARK